MKPIKDRFMAKVAVEGDCWLWAGSTDRKGYGRFAVAGRNTLAHRWIYEQEKGEIHKGMVIDHLCRNRRCVNPNHMEVVTSQVNTLRGETIAAKNLSATHCPKGHAYTEGNFYRRSSDGGRQCRPCALAIRKKRYQEKGR
jgi:hypothetical protein